MVDSMATFWVVPSVSMLHRVTNPKPGFSIETANGMVPVSAVGVALAYFLLGDTWVCHEVPNVLVLDGCPAILYSTRAMKKLHGFKHDIDAGIINVQGTNGIAIADDGAAYTIPVAFVPPGAATPRGCVYPSTSTPVADLAGTTSAFPAGVAGTPQATLFHRLGFPYDDQWRHVASATSGHGLPPDARLVLRRLRRALGEAVDPRPRGPGPAVLAGAGLGFGGAVVDVAAWRALRTRTRA